MFLEKINLDKDITYACRYTRLNGEKLSNDSRNKRVGTGFYTLGHNVTKNKDGTFKWSTWTVENACHVYNFHCDIAEDGKLLGGRINLFGLGFMDLDDQDYIDELLDEMNESKRPWDEIKKN